MQASKSLIREWLLLVSLTLGLMLLQGSYRFWMFAETFAIKQGSINADVMINAFWNSAKLQGDLLHYLLMQFLLHLSLGGVTWWFARRFIERFAALPASAKTCDCSDLVSTCAVCLSG